MYKKQLLKVGHGKKSKVISGLVLSLVLVGMIAGSVSAGDYQDSPYSYSVKQYGVATETRAKDDYTSAYIWHKGDSPINVLVESCGINYSVNPSGYGIAPGDHTYLPNYVKENSQNTCYLFLTPMWSGWRTLYGQWSPDSV